MNELKTGNKMSTNRTKICKAVEKAKKTTGKYCGIENINFYTYNDDPELFVTVSLMLAVDSTTSTSSDVNFSLRKVKTIKGMVSIFEEHINSWYGGGR
jgi:hypothetical protein